ncbi:MAG: ZIP family metal transporter [Thermoplasmatales archaeon]|nr:MAG: ZIP family metal transporter [Thermoplasmatales archaeon]
MIELIYAILAGLTISLISLALVLLVSLREKILDDILLPLVALSAGAVIGGAFLHLLPEAIELTEEELIFPTILIGFIVFYILEKSLHHHHVNKKGEHAHTFHYMTIIGASIHSILDGIIIVASFVVSIPIGIATFIMVASHEIPKKVGDFGVLVYGGINKKRAIIINFILSLGLVIGAIVGFIISRNTEKATEILLPLAAGGFIYIGAADLLPEFRKEIDLRKSIIVFEFFILGILIMWLINIVFHHVH